MAGIDLPGVIAAAQDDLRNLRLDAALAGFDAVLRADPGHPLALSGRAGVLVHQQRQDEALACLEAALARDPSIATIWRERGDLLLAMDRPQQALDSYERAIAWDYNVFGGMYGAGRAALRLGRTDAALARFAIVVQRRPDWAPVRRERAAAWLALGKYEEAVADYDVLLQLEPQDTAALADRGNALQALGRHAEAVESYSRANALRPDDAIVINNRGVSLWRSERHAEAAEDFRRAAALAPDLAPAQANMGMLLEEVGDVTGARQHYQRALAAAPDELMARIGMVSACLPPVRESADDLEAIRAAHARALDELFAWAATPAISATLVGAVSAFNLAYHDRDNRAAISQFGAHCVAAMERWRLSVGFERAAPMPPGNGRRIRLGIVSSQFWTHSVWLAIVRGWIGHLDPARFEIHLFHTGRRQDEQTEWARRHVAALTYGLGEFDVWARAINDWRPDILIYPDVGMEPLPLRLACLRLADMQAVSWGHPETTGLSTIDHYISAEAFEPPGAQDYYSEKLIMLPRLGCCYTELPVEPVAPDLEKLGVRGDVPILLCPGTPFKYAPEHDRVLVEIAQRLGACQFIFFAYLRSPPLAALLRARIGRAFAAAGLNADDFLVMVPWHLTPWFFGLMQRADVFLDTIGFSGFNTAIQAIECGLPVVTMEGSFMRGRLASGILRTMEMPELVAPDTDAYVDIAVRLASDTAYRNDIRARIAQQRHLLFGDVEAVRAFEDFLLRTAAQGSVMPAR
jgi:protein O-GlcNAc transferase